jgi:hypothetical protein
MSAVRFPFICHFIAAMELANQYRFDQEYLPLYWVWFLIYCDSSASWRLGSAFGQPRISKTGGMPCSSGIHNGMQRSGQPV